MSYCMGQRKRRREPRSDVRLQEGLSIYSAEAFGTVAVLLLKHAPACYGLHYTC